MSVGQASGRRRRFLACGSAHPVQNIFVRNDLRSLPGVGDVAGNVRASDGHSDFAQGFVTAGLVGMHTSVNDVLQGLIR